MLERIRESLSDDVDQGLAAAYIFGSYATGRAHRDSDVDVALLLDPKHYPTPRTRSEARLDFLMRFGDRLGVSVDLVILNDAPPLLGRQIITHGRRICAPAPEIDHDYRGDVQLRAADLAPFIRSHQRRLREVLAR